MIEPSSGSLEWPAINYLLTIAGALITFRGWAFLLAGYDETAPVPESVVGNTVLRGAVAVLLVGILAFVTTPPSYLDAMVKIAIVLEVLRLLYRLNTWSPPAS